MNDAIVVPFNLDTNLNFRELKLCVLPVLIEGTSRTQAFDLILDTGSEVTYLSTTIAKAVGIEVQQGSSRGHSFASRSQLQLGIVNNITIKSWSDPDLHSTVGIISLGRSTVRIGAPLQGKFADYSILGVLGAETIQKLCLKIDYPGKYLELSQILPTDPTSKCHE